MRYSAFGLCFDSEFELPELAPADPARDPDVTIRLGSTPKQLDTVLGDGVFYTLNHDEFLLSLEEVGTFYVHHGQEILIEPAQDVHWPYLRLILFDSPLAALLQQRKMFALNACAIDTPRGTIIFCGSSVTGKSTLAASFARRGYPIVADNTCVIDIDQDKPITLYPGKRTQHLWKEALDYLEIDSAPLVQVLPHKNLFALPLEPLAQEQYTPIHIFVINFRNNVDIVTTDPITGLGKLERLAWLSYFNFFLNQMGRGTQHHSLLVQLTSQLPMTHLQREAQLKHMPDVVDHIEQQYIL